jgi:hypothetical protein
VREQEERHGNATYRGRVRGTVQSTLPEHSELAKFLDKAYAESVEEARNSPPPRTVEAYRQVYGRWPNGWPPEVKFKPSK